MKYALSVEEPDWNVVVSWVLHDLNNQIDFFRRELSCSLCEIYVGSLAHNVGEASSDSFDGSERVHYFSFSIDICVENTQNVLELVVIFLYNEHFYYFDWADASNARAMSQNYVIYQM